MYSIFFYFKQNSKEILAKRPVTLHEVDNLSKKLITQSEKKSKHDADLIKALKERITMYEGMLP